MVSATYARPLREAKLKPRAVRFTAGVAAAERTTAPAVEVVEAGAGTGTGAPKGVVDIGAGVIMGSGPGGIDSDISGN
jgi:hypothetical protein